MKFFSRIGVLTFFLIISHWVSGQDRFEVLEEKLSKIAKEADGLKETADFSVSGVSIQEFLRGIAESHNLNISVDPKLDIKITNNFTNEKVNQIFLFLCREYDLDITFVGTIMSFKKYSPRSEAPVALPAKELNISNNSYAETISWDLYRDTLSKVVKKITQLSKKNVLIGAGLENKVVSGYVENMPFEGAIEKLAYTNELRYRKTKDNFYLIEKVEPENVSAANTTPSYNNSNNLNFGNRSGGNLLVEVVQLDSNKRRINVDAVNVPIVEIIKAASKEYKSNFFMFSEPKGNTTARVTGLTYDELLTFLMQGTDFTYKNQDGVYMIGDRIQEGLRAHRVIQLKHRSVETILDNIPAELKKGVDIKHFKELNGLICSGSEPRINELQILLVQLDKVVPMILIEAMIVNVRKSRTVSTGISAGIGDSTVVTKGTLLPKVNMTMSASTINNVLDLMGANSVFNLGKVSPNFYVNVSAFEDQGNYSIQSTPKLSTLNSHEASLKIGETRYYQLATQNTLGSLTPTTIRTVQYNSVQADLVLKINPTVSSDDQVTLEIDVSNSTFTDIPLEGPPPTLSSSFKSVIRVKNEEMIVLGGLEKLQKSDNSTGVPLLSRIPVLKWIFSKRTKIKGKERQLVFIKPTIIY